MGVSGKITGSADIRAAAKAFRQASRSDLRKEMLAGIRQATKPIGPEVRKSLPQYTPSDYTPVLSKALRFTTKTKTSGWPEVTVTAQAKGRKKERHLKAINAGKLRHPLFGNRQHWYAQKIKAGFFDDPAKRVLQDVRREVGRAVDRVKAKLERA